MCSTFYPVLLEDWHMKNVAFWIGILGGLILAACFGFLLLPNLGVFDMTATGKPGILDWWGRTNLKNSVKRRAPKAMIPAAADSSKGAGIYQSICIYCHGAPNAPREKWAHYMLPEPPKLWEKEIQEMTDGELFFIVSHGIRMTGMPAFGADRTDMDIWNVVAYIRLLPPTN